MLQYLQYLLVNLLFEVIKYNRITSGPTIKPATNVDFQNKNVNIYQSPDFTDMNDLPNPLVLERLEPEQFIPLFERHYLSTPEATRSCIYDILGVPLGSDITKLNLNPTDIATEIWIADFILALSVFGLSGFYHKGVWPTPVEYPRFSNFVEELVANLCLIFKEYAHFKVVIQSSSDYNIKLIVQTLTSVPFNARSIGKLYSVKFNQPSCSCVNEALASYLDRCRALDLDIYGGGYLGLLRSAIANCSDHFDQSLLEIIQPLMSDKSLAIAHPLDIHEAILESPHIESFEFALWSLKQKNTRPRKSAGVCPRPIKQSFSFSSYYYYYCYSPELARVRIGFNNSNNN